jgi:hypothetical protein
MNRALGHNVALENSATCFIEDTSSKTGRGESTIRRKIIHEQLYPETRGPKEGGAFRGNQHQKEVTLENSVTNFVVAAGGRYPVAARPA